MTSSYLLHGREALELGAAEVLLLQGRRLQHEVLLLGRVHLLQVLGRRAGLPVQGLLDHLQRAGGAGGGAGKSPRCGQACSTPSLPSCSDKDQAFDPHSPGSRGDDCVQSSTRPCLAYLAALLSTHAPCSSPIWATHATTTNSPGSGSSGDRSPLSLR